MRSVSGASLVLAALCAGVVWAQPLSETASLSLSPGSTARVEVPAAPPFTSLGDTRFELRMHDWKTPSSNTTIFWNSGIHIQLRSSSELCAADLMDATPAYGGMMCADISGRSDITMRAQRDTANKVFRLEVRSTAGDWSTAGYCGTKQNGGTYNNTFPCPIETVYYGSWAGGSVLGGYQTQLRLAWLKWFASVVPAGSGLLGEGTPADLGDWRFEGDLTNQAPSGVYINALSGAGGDAGSGVLYAPTPSLPPVCDAGTQQVLRAGYPAQLNGSGSYPVNGAAGLAYRWEQTSGPSNVAWSSNFAAQPQVSGLVFGSYIFKLTVTDSSGQSSSCSVKHGAVESDDNGIVITHNGAVDKLLGPMVRFGANPWPWFDDRNKAEADMQSANLDRYYGAYWDPSSPAYGSSAAQGAWLYNVAPANYYDNVAGFYALYYRTGLDDYLAAARKLADRFWVSPMVNAGTTCDAWANMTACYPARSLSVMGLILRALDGRPDMWPGLRIIFNSYRTYYLDFADRLWGMWDIREMAYHLAVVSYCAMFDPDDASRQSCKASISGSFPAVWTPGRAADGSFPSLFEKASSWSSGGKVLLSKGSNVVQGVGTNWDAGMLQCWNATGHQYPCQMWFTNDPGAKPASNADGDPVAYAATFVDATRLTLDRPYEGVTGEHGWALPDASAGLVGYGSQPFIQGILGAAFDLAAKAIADTDPANAAMANNYNVGIARWLLAQGYWQTTKGLYYGVGHINCPSPISDNDAFCTGGNNAGEARVLSAEALRSVMTAYAYSGDIGLKTLGDTLFSAMFSKPGTGSPNPDGEYINALDDGNGWYMIGAPPTGQAPKYFGMFFGFSGLAAWPGYRVGGWQAQTGSYVAPDTLSFGTAGATPAVATLPDGVKRRVGKRPASGHAIVRDDGEREPAH